MVFLTLSAIIVQFNANSLDSFVWCPWLCFCFLSLFDVLFVACAISYCLFARAYIIVLYSADVGRILYINGYHFIFLAYTNVCSVTELT